MKYRHITFMGDFDGGFFMYSVCLIRKCPCLASLSGLKNDSASVNGRILWPGPQIVELLRGRVIVLVLTT